MSDSAYDSDAMRLLSDALEVVLIEVKRSHVALGSEGPLLTSRITRELIQAYDQGVHDIDALKRLALEAIEPPIH
ncbi:MAG: hypothetical protein JO107_00945 [Hyphomicrobiales bacterium]|nr:hypothetical protein [Hyphomicrobiales bacterium]MBV8661643.1 hypothetical protein [Hyphomicrobiales bacterium]